MSKLSYEDKIKIYKLRKKGKQISYLSAKYKVRSDNSKKENEEASKNTPIPTITPTSTPTLTPTPYRLQHQ